MNRKAMLLSIATPFLMVSSFILGFYVSGPAPRASAGLLRKLSEVGMLIQARYPDDVPAERLERGAVDGILQALDPACEYYTAEEWEDWQERHMSGKFHGVGILVEPDPATGYLLIVTPIEDTPAFAADILPGDLILAVDGVDIKGMPISEVIRRIKGEKGTSVTLALYRKDRDRFDVTLARAEIKIQAVKHRMLDPERGLGYIRVSNFTDMMSQFDAAMAELRQQGLRGLIIDLRFNGGGLLEAAVALSDRFIPAGRVLLSTRGKTSTDNRQIVSTSENDLPDVPLVVLVNGGTASASEIFAGAMRDLRRGAVVGSRTFGKGTVQTPFDLSDGSHLKLTTARWMTPSGENVNRDAGRTAYGIQPDYVVEMSEKEEAELMKRWRDELVVKGGEPANRDTAADPPLNSALEILRARLDGREPNVPRRDVSRLDESGGHVR